MNIRLLRRGADLRRHDHRAARLRDGRGIQTFALMETFGHSAKHVLVLSNILAGIEADPCKPEYYWAYTSC
jgi:hypothetical protein